MAALTPVTKKVTANATTFAAGESGGDKFANPSGSALLFVSHTNGGGSTVTLTITTSQTIEGLALADRTVAIGAGEFHVLGPFPKNTYNDVDGNVNISYSDETDIEVAVVA